MTVQGFNNSSSDNQLWVQLYRSDFGLNDKITEEEIAIGTSYSWKKNVSDGNYYIHLDPDGPNYNGVIGSGSATN
ncbi:hypothetical protein ACFO9Q_03860 [Paenibacillus sp. GCM10023252]|uniref:hypothetical protein n=1 Tax=Paenibacillus sp. GCM10023252 TaxID=3252649 RepID=UPI00361DE48B